MAKTVADMTATELRRVVSSVVEEKLMQLLGDPDEGLVLRDKVRERLLRQKRAVSKGERGESLEAVERRLKLCERVQSSHSQECEPATSEP